MKIFQSIMIVQRPFFICKHIDETIKIEIGLFLIVNCILSVFGMKLLVV